MNRPCAQPIPLLVGVVLLLAAARALEPDGGKAASFVLEIGSALVFGLLIVAVARGACLAKKTLSEAPDLPSAFTTSGVTLARDGMIVTALLAPAFVAGWEVGGTAAELVRVAIGSAAVCGIGFPLGFLLVIGRLPEPTAVLLASATTALTLWPGSLRWIDMGAPRFPAPELPAAALIVMLASMLAMVFLMHSNRKRLG